MKAFVSLAPRLTMGICGLMAIAGSEITAAQTVATVSMPSVLTLPATPQIYQDHYIDDGALKPDISADSLDSASSGGLARSLQVDGILSVLRSTEPGSH